MARPSTLPPALDALLSHPAARPLLARHGRERLKEGLRASAERLRRGELSAPDGGREELTALLVEETARRLEARPPAGPRRVLNATGVLLHTNLGRAPLAEAAREAVQAAAGYCALELDLSTGERGRRSDHVRGLLLALFAPGREDLDALSVTNTAAALLLALDTAANGRPVAVSRGELVAIGGDFRVPSILARSGASLLEVGTTNRTTLEDYREALDAGAAAVLKVHPSNYRIVGFTEEVPLPGLSPLCRERGVPLLFDAGTAAPVRLALGGGQPPLPTPLDAVDSGADLVCFSGDKTLGGPQAGILLGRSDLVRRAGRNPLARALRMDKLALAALAATLDLHLSGRGEEVPFFRMLATPAPELESRARALVSRLAPEGVAAEAVPSEATAGGGSGAGSAIPSWAVAVTSPRLSATALAGALRSRRLPVLARVAGDRLLLDLRTVDPSEDGELLDALLEAVRG